MDVDGPGLAGEVGAPDVLQQRVAGQDHTGVPGQGGEKVELAGAQAEIPAGDGRFAPAGIDPERADLDRPPAAGRSVGPAQDCLDPGDERARVEGLGDVVVRAELQADDRVDVVVARGQHQDGGVAPPPDLAADLEAVELGKHHVEDHEVRIVPGVAVERVDAVMRGDDREAVLLEVQPDEVDDVALVVDDEDRLHRASRVRVGRRLCIAAEDTPRPCARSRPLSGERKAGPVSRPASARRRRPRRAAGEPRPGRPSAGGRPRSGGRPGRSFGSSGRPAGRGSNRPPAARPVGSS